KKPDLYTILNKFRNSEATDFRDKIYTLLGISLNIYDINLLRVNYRKSLKDIIFNTASFLLNFNKLDPLIYRFFD
ncbi:hypothetical protein BKA65DRAFT_415300, partial [Rhexocercosporidium sp. MPI-PUGE-AT-0058]